MKPIGLVPELYCTSLEKTLSFYVDLLNFKVLYQREEEKFIYLGKGNVELMFEEVGVGRNWITEKLEYPFGRGVNFQIEVDYIDDLYKAVNQNGLKPFMHLEEKWYRKNNDLVGNRQFIIQDPDGYLLRFYQDLGIKSV